MATKIPVIPKKQKHRQTDSKKMTTKKEQSQNKTQNARSRPILLLLCRRQKIQEGIREEKDKRKCVKEREERQKENKKGK